MRLHVPEQVQWETGKPGRGEIPQTRQVHLRRETSHLQDPREILIEPCGIRTGSRRIPGLALRCLPSLLFPTSGASAAFLQHISLPASRLEVVSEVAAVWEASMAVAGDVAEKQHLGAKGVGPNDVDL